MPETEKGYTRRQLLTFWKKSSTEIPVHEEVKSEVVISAAQTMSRRQVIIDAGVVVSALVAGYCFGTPIAEASDSIPQRSPVPNQPREPGPKDEPTLIDTALVSALFSGFDLAVGLPLAFLALFKKIPLGSTSWTDVMINKELEKPLLTILRNRGINSLIEELEWRALPSFLLGGNLKEDHWEWGIPVSAAFAIWHNWNDGKFGKSIPLPQFTKGLVMWYMMRERGLPHAWISHWTMNAINFTLAKKVYDMLPKKHPIEESKVIANSSTSTEKTKKLKTRKREKTERREKFDSNI